MTDSGALTLNGTLNNGGTCTILGTLSISANARLTDGAGSRLLLGNTAVVSGPGMIGNAGTIIKSAGGGTATISSNIANTGSIQVAQGKLDITGAITGTGSLTIGAGRTLELGGSVAAGQTVTFGSSTGKLQLDDAHSYAGKISGFIAGDVLDLRGFLSTRTAITFTENANMTSGVLKVNSGTQSASLTILGNHDAALFHIASDGAGGTAITYGSAAMGAAAPATTNDAFAQALFDAAFAPAAHVEAPATSQAASSSVITASALSSPHATHF